jgi:molybdate transport system substrate-binding protein
MRHHYRLIFTAWLMCLAGHVTAAQINVAVAANFRFAGEALALRYEQNTGHEVRLIFGSTGKHFAQIQNGAPFDIFLAADELRPRMLEEDGQSVNGTRFIYAIGKLVLWSPRVDENTAPLSPLEAGNFRFLAIANPTFAPYGRAARQYLQSLNLWNSIQPRLVRGENIGQAYQYVVSANADLGLIAYSQIRLPSKTIVGSYWDVPPSAYDAIRQQGILLKDTPAARGFLEYLRSDEALEIIESYGYILP